MDKKLVLGKMDGFGKYHCLPFTYHLSPIFKAFYEVVKSDKYHLCAQKEQFYHNVPKATLVLGNALQRVSFSTLLVYF